MHIRPLFRNNGFNLYNISRNKVGRQKGQLVTFLQTRSNTESVSLETQSVFDIFGTENSVLECHPTHLQRLIIISTFKGDLYTIRKR